MRATDLHLFEILDPCPDEGSIRFKDRRMLLWDADAFGSLRKELIDCVDRPRARSILRRFGFANGYRDALTAQQLFSWDNDREWWLACPALQRHEGKVYTSPTRLELDRERGVFEMEVDWQRSYEAEQHLRIFGRCDDPVCWTLAGYASGYSTACFGEEIFVVEQECAAQGAPGCRVVGRTRRAWGDLGDQFAADYDARPLAAELERLEHELAARTRELRRLRKRAGRDAGPMISNSTPMQRALELADTVSRVDATVLITGESGVGKERLARYIHGQSRRADHSFVALNCGALPEPLLESELFGHVRGAFTGADADKAGLFAAAHGGTILLDEIGETSPGMQVKLLRVLQEREIRKVGSTRDERIDVRVLAATNADLETAIEEGAFRSDLYYRLKVVTIEIPPLRRRREDVIALAREFATAHCAAYSKPPVSMSPQALEALLSHPWPGNVRELSHAIEHAIVMADGGSRIELSHLPAQLRGVAPLPSVPGDEILPLAEVERRYVMAALDRCGGHRARTAEVLGIGANTLWRKLKAWGVPPARE